MITLPLAARRLCLLLCLAPALQPAHAASDLPRWQAQAVRVSITRDDWGIAHVTGRSDADAVFGAIYAQAEDDFGRIEANYLTALGRSAEADGEAAIWGDLRQRLFVDPAELQAQYRASPAWLKQLMNAWADGLNYYLATHPATTTHMRIGAEERARLGITDGTVRLSVGLEDVQDLIDELTQALEKVS